MELYQQFQLSMQHNKPELALKQLRQHLIASPRHADAHFQAGNLLRELGKWPESLNAFHEACRLNPKNVEFQLSRGIILTQMQLPLEAIEAFTTAYALKQDPGILYNRSMALLLAGRYLEAWPEYENRNLAPGKSKVIYDWYPAKKRWQGQPFPGQTLVVFNEQGLGDDLQFCRYLPYLKALGGSVVMITQKPLVPIMSTLYGVDHVCEFSPANHEKLQTCDWFIPLMSLPYLFHTSLDSIPNHTPYLAVPPGYSDKWLPLLAPHIKDQSYKKIGLVYSSTNDKLFNHARTCPLPLWQPLFSLPGIQWYSLQKGDGATPPLIVDLTSHIEDFGDTAALLEQLDLLISIDTSVPHLAGALGKPVWLLTPYIAQWRWLQYRSDSPWYPSFRLFRQPAPNAWEPVLAQVKQALSIPQNSVRSSVHPPLCLPQTIV